MTLRELLLISPFSTCGNRLRMVKRLVHSHTDYCVGQQRLSPGLSVNKPVILLYYKVSLSNISVRISGRMQEVEAK